MGLTETLLRNHFFLPGLDLPMIVLEVLKAAPPEVPVPIAFIGRIFDINSAAGSRESVAGAVYDLKKRMEWNSAPNSRPEIKYIYGRGYYLDPFCPEHPYSGHNSSQSEHPNLIEPSIISVEMLAPFYNLNSQDKILRALTRHLGNEVVIEKLCEEVYPDGSWKNLSMKSVTPVIRIYVSNLRSWLRKQAEAARITDIRGAAYVMQCSPEDAEALLARRYIPKLDDKVKSG